MLGTSSPANRFAVLLIHITLLFTVIEAASLHSSSSNHHRALGNIHRQLLHRADAEPPISNAPNCPKRNHFKKLKEAQDLAAGKLPTNGTTPSSSTISTTLTSTTVSATTSTSPTVDVESTKKPASTSSAPAKPDPTKDTTSPAPGGLSSLFPVGQTSKSWTTSPISSDALSLSEGTLNPFQVARANPYDITKAPDGRMAVKAHFERGSYKLLNSPQGGFSFYATGPDRVDLTTAKEATFGYRVYFPGGFDFNKGGKLPGFFGGDSQGDSTSCSGGRHSTACFSARLMWREDGDGELYTYFPPGFAANNKLCSVKPFSDCNPEYGNSVGRGSFKFARGAWTTVAERVKLNDVGASNGEVQVWVNGQSVINVSGLVLRAHGPGRIRGIQCQTFFGGNSQDWASPKDQDAFFADFSVAITESF